MEKPKAQSESGRQEGQRLRDGQGRMSNNKRLVELRAAELGLGGPSPNPYHVPTGPLACDQLSGTLPTHPNPLVLILHSQTPISPAAQLKVESLFGWVRQCWVISVPLELHLGPVTGLGDSRGCRWQGCDCGTRLMGRELWLDLPSWACVGGWGGVDSGCHPRSFKTQRAPVGVGVCVCVCVGGDRQSSGETQRKGRSRGNGTI